MSWSEAKTKRFSTAALLLLLALASFAVATISLTNITEWYVIAKHPPIVKVVGSSLQNTSYIYNQVGYVYADFDGTNRTVIQLTAFTGDPTKYSEVIKVCNKDNQTYRVRLVYQGLITSYNWDMVQYLDVWIGNENNKLALKNANVGASTEWVNVSPGGCVSVGAEILVKANAANGATVVGFRVDVVSERS